MTLLELALWALVLLGPPLYLKLAGVPFDPDGLSFDPARRVTHPLPAAGSLLLNDKIAHAAGGFLCALLELALTPGAGWLEAARAVMTGVAAGSAYELAAALANRQLAGRPGYGYSFADQAAVCIGAALAAVIVSAVRLLFWPR